MKTRNYYFTLMDFQSDYNYDLTPYKASKLASVIDEVLGTLTYYPISLSDTNIEKLWQALIAEKRYDPIFKITRPFCDSVIPETTDTEPTKEFENWLIRLLSIIEKTYDYYNAVLTNYAAAASHLMDDIKATSKNKVKFNDTPQNDGTGGTYEGDNYITHFTSTEGETFSPLTTMINRLKEIQDQYKRTMADWLKEVGRIFLPEGD